VAGRKREGGKREGGEAIPTWQPFFFFFFFIVYQPATRLAVRIKSVLRRGLNFPENELIFSFSFSSPPTFLFDLPNKLFP